MKFDGDGRDQVELIKGAAGLLRAVAQRAQEPSAALGINALPSQPSAASPVNRRFCGPIAAT